MNINDAKLFVEALSLIFQVIRLFPKEQRNRIDEDEKALAALSDAYVGTLQYYEYLKSHPRNKSKEIEVAHKWEHVGILLKKYDSTLAKRLSAKSRYWRQGTTWSKTMIREAGIGLENIRREVKLRLDQ